jgi:hypothetical protein
MLSHLLSPLVKLKAETTGLTWTRSLRHPSRRLFLALDLDWLLPSG